MRLSAALSLVASLALAAAVPVQSVELTVLNPDNFKPTIADGVWLIEHFSPYCHHCRDFAPTWQELVDRTQAKADPGIHLAQVNCAVDGDLCSENGVKGYPQINLYKNGKYVDQFRKARSLELLEEFIAQHAEPTSKPIPPAPTTTQAPTEAPSPPPPVSRKLPNPRGAVLSLTGNTFQDALKDGPLFVKFFAPWCGHCKKLAPVWVDLARHMADKLTVAEVNCEEHSALCKNQDVTGYPMLYFYPGGGAAKTEYTGGRKLEALKAFAERAVSPAVQEIEYDKLHQVVEEHPVFYLLLHAPEDTRTVNDVTQAAHVLLGSPPIYTSSSPAFLTHFSLPASSLPILLALKDHDPTLPVSTYHPPAANSKHTTSIENTQRWLLSNRLPTTTELSSESFQAIMKAPHKPLVVLVAVPDTQDAQTIRKVRDIGKQWRNRQGAGDVVFTWMDAGQWGKWLKSMYGIRKGDLPGVVIAEHEKLMYYDTDEHGHKIQLEADSIFSAIDGVRKGTIRAKHSENIVERLARYLNAKMIAVEYYVSHHPWRTLLFAVSFLSLLALAAKRFLASDNIYEYREHKSNRLD
ncbi:thioredoxin-domain-containing protein [Gloeophyllum trabeum ATCC 11539]|uniref:Thioredoxin-domain-containing protein n=1 Tax=Gloeophyllum trabeum (strain ATCC 11539 / FP-39264 / Madison 617) TaxID=670483 RepID=S7QK31_GLOTA|nr:thioredoxin-domain-containing protein [Gloeophyllum trabeum ATCC 11539]EPQ59737.1 thioredoxin-domain-containing protein [Gloeophyllum trabeum ATCC 11539]